MTGFAYGNPVKIGTQWVPVSAAIGIVLKIVFAWLVLSSTFLKCLLRITVRALCSLFYWHEVWHWFADSNLVGRACV